MTGLSFFGGLNLGSCSLLVGRLSSAAGLELQPSTLMAHLIEVDVFGLHIIFPQVPLSLSVHLRMTGQSLLESIVGSPSLLA